MLVLQRSILTEKVARRGYHVTREYAIDPLEVLFVRDVMTREFTHFFAKTPLPEVVATFVAQHGDSREQQQSERLYPVLDDDERLVAVVTRSDLFRAALARNAALERALLQLASTDPEVCYADMTLREAAHLFAERGISRAPVVARSDPSRVVGMVSGRPARGPAARPAEERIPERVLICGTCCACGGARADAGSRAPRPRGGASFSHTTSSATSPRPAAVSKPQSVPASTRRGSPTARAARLDALGDDLGMLDVVGGRVDHAGDEHPVGRQRVPREARGTRAHGAGWPSRERGRRRARAVEAAGRRRAARRRCAGPRSCPSRRACGPDRRGTLASARLIAATCVDEGEEVAERPIGEAGVALHRQVGAVELQDEPRATIASYSGRSASATASHVVARASVVRVLASRAATMPGEGAVMNDSTNRALAAAPAVRAKASSSRSSGARST